MVTAAKSSSKRRSSIVTTPAGTISRFFVKQSTMGSAFVAELVIAEPEMEVPERSASAAHAATLAPEAAVELSATRVTASAEASVTSAMATDQPLSSIEGTVSVATDQPQSPTKGSVSELQLGALSAPCLCTRDAVAANSWVQEVLSDAKESSGSIAVVVGLDCEWLPPWHRAPGALPDRVATIQLCHLGKAGPRTLVLQVSGLNGKLPEDVAALLDNKRIAKVGAGVVGDGSRLARDFGCSVHSLYDLCQMDKKNARSLEDLVRAHCPEELHISKSSQVSEKRVRTSNWEVWPLSTLQIDYAARDAALSVLAFAYRFDMMGNNRYGLSESAMAALVELKSAVTSSDGLEQTPATPSPTKKAASTDASASKKKAVGRKPKVEVKAAKQTSPDKAAVATAESATPAEAPPAAAAAGDDEAEVETAVVQSQALVAAGLKKRPAAAPKLLQATKRAKGSEATDEAADDPTKELATDGTDKPKKDHSHFFTMMRNKSVEIPNIGNKAHPRGSATALSSVCIVVSGILDSFERKDFEKYVIEHGGKISKGVTGKVTHVVNDHGEAGPAKVAKCKELGIPIVSEDVILEMVSAAGGA